MLNKKKNFIDKIPNWGWLLISLAVAVVLWFFLSIGEKTGRCFPFADKVFVAL